MQPKLGHSRNKPQIQTKNLLFDQLNVGDEFSYQNRVGVKITCAYFNVGHNKRVNALFTDTGEAIYVHAGLCVEIL